jgi:hypothetical protein
MRHGSIVSPIRPLIHMFVSFRFISCEASFAYPEGAKRVANHRASFLLFVFPNVTMFNPPLAPPSPSFPLLWSRARNSLSVEARS